MYTLALNQSIPLRNNTGKATPKLSIPQVLQMVPYELLKVSTLVHHESDPKHIMLKLNYYCCINKHIYCSLVLLIIKWLIRSHKQFSITSKIIIPGI